jgi:alpha-glucosidase
VVRLKCSEGAVEAHHWIVRHAANRACLVAIVWIGVSLWNACCGASLESPNGRLHLNVQLAKEGQGSVLKYSVSFDDSPIIRDSQISFLAADGRTIGANLRSQSKPRSASHDSTWRPVYGERGEVVDQYNQLQLKFVDKISGHVLQVEFRCYDAGVAFRTKLIAPKADPRIHITEERSEFRFLADHTAWCAKRAQDEYFTRQLSEIAGSVERPLTIEINKELYAVVAEAGLVDYAVMYLRRSQHDPLCVVSHLGGDVKADGELCTPWRVVMVGKSPGELLENNFLLLNLNEPCAIADTSWIKPGKVLREITLSTEGAKACVDFAVKHNLQYIEFDAGWYGHEYDDNSDATTVNVDVRRSNGKLDLPYVIDYAAERDIGIILYVNRRALEKQLDEILPLYQSWGVKGVKYGFVQTGSQEWTRWLHHAVREAADHQLMVDVHDEYRPTGYSRTYPNLMSQEGVRGDEATPTSGQAVTTLFTRNLAGAADHTICYFDPRVKKNWTHGHQLAKSVCTYSPWQFLYWYDTPLVLSASGQHRNAIVETPELEFFAQVPTVWDDTRVIRGSIGEYTVIARRSGSDWYIGALNSGQQRELTVPLNFLMASHSYKARVYSDDPDTETLTRVRIDEQLVDAKTNLKVSMAANGGQAIWLTPVEPVATAAQVH